MKYEVVRQRDLKDCGVACLLMIIKFYGGYIPLSKLRELTHTTSNGVSAYNIKTAAESIGFKVEGLKIDNFNNIKLPVIAHVCINNFNHYVVIYKIKDKELIIGDPKDKVKKIKLEEFNKIFTNVILTFELKRKLPLYKNNISFYPFILNILKKYKIHIFLSLIYSITISLLSLLLTFHLEILSNNISLLFKTTIFFTIIYFLKNILIFIRNRNLFKIQKELESDLTTNIFKRIIKLPYEYFKNRTTGEVITRINDLKTIIETILKIVLTLFIDIIFLLLALIVLLIINIKLSLICILIISIYLIINLIFNRFILNKIKILKEEESSLNSYLYESINNFETIKGLNIETSIINRHKKINCNYINNKYELNKLMNKENIICNIIKDIGLILILFVGANLVLNGIFRIEQLFTISLLYLYFISPIESIVDLIKNIKEAKISYERLDELLYEEKEIITNNNIRFKKIKIKNLSFDYYGNKSVLDNLNIKLNCNKIMILGESGSGKSTLLKLLKRYYQIPDNKIFIDNIDINKISKYELNNSIKYVSQNENLFTDTLFNNITLYRNNKLKDKLKLSCLPYENKIIEENGFNISGGEKQRIVLARSLIDDFKILILDEVFSQMDVDMERKILKNLFKKYRNKKIIIVSHRNNNIDLFDQVIEIENGKVLNNIERRKDYVKVF